MKPPRQATSVDEIIPRPNPEQGVDPEAAAEQRRFASGAREARNQVSDYAGKLGDLFGGGAYTRLHIAAVLEVLCLISIVSLSVWAPETPRIEKAIDHLEQAFLILLGFLVGTSLPRAD